MCYENINGGLERLAFSDLTGMWSRVFWWFRKKSRNGVACFFFVCFGLTLDLGGVAQRAFVPPGFKVNADGSTGVPFDRAAPIEVVDDSVCSPQLKSLDCLLRKFLHKHNSSHTRPAIGRRPGWAFL